MVPFPLYCCFYTSGKAWWLNGSTSDCCPAVPGSGPSSLQPTADYQSSGGLPPGTWLRPDLCEERQRRKLRKMPKTYKEKKNFTQVIINLFYFKVVTNNHLFHLSNTFLWSMLNTNKWYIFSPLYITITFALFSLTKYVDTLTERRLNINSYKST